MTIKTIDTGDSALRQYLDEAGELPTDVLLGRIVPFTITDEPVAHADLERWFDELDLDKALLPFPIKEIHAFKKATSSIDKKKYALKGGSTAHMLCRDVASTPDFVRRQITREVQDSNKKKLFYNAAIEATFYRAGNGGSPAIKMKINRDEVLAEEIDHLRKVAGQIEETYRRHVEFHDGMKMRALVRAYLTHLNAIKIKDGFYFVHASRDAELSALTELINRFGGGCWMKTLPLVDLTNEREFITAAFEREAAQALQEVTRDIKAAIAAGNTTGPAYAKLKERYDEVLNSAEEHQLKLGVSQDLTAASAEVALRELTKLQEKMIA